MRTFQAILRQREPRWIVAITLLGLILRLAAAQGTLWSDEAWSAILAHDVRTPLGIFVGINHDNNHHLNSLWLQTVGLGAPPVLARALSIAASTCSIIVAGAIGARRGACGGIVMALLFALSPLLVTLGSEARGYAPMMLMALVSIWYVDRYLDGEADANRPVTLATCFFVGALFQLTMAFAACALAGWLFLVLCRRKGVPAAILETVKLLGPAIAALILALLIAFGPVLLGFAEFRFGARQPFTVLLFLHGLVHLFGYTVGVPVISFWLPAGAAILVILARGFGTSRLPFYWLAIIAFPLSVAALNLINAGHPRYYLLAGLALLLLMGEMLAALIRAGGWKAWGAVAALVAFSGASMALDVDLIRSKRGDILPAILALKERSPRGAHVFIDRETGYALLKVAAAEAGYPIDIASTCPAGPFVFADWFNGEPGSPRILQRCGATFRPIADGRARGLSGQNWTLYERVD